MKHKSTHKHPDLWVRKRIGVPEMAHVIVARLSDNDASLLKLRKKEQHLVAPAGEAREKGCKRESYQGRGGRDTPHSSSDGWVKRTAEGHIKRWNAQHPPRLWVIGVAHRLPLASSWPCGPKRRRPSPSEKAWVDCRGDEAWSPRC